MQRCTWGLVKVVLYLGALDAVFFRQLFPLILLHFVACSVPVVTVSPSSPLVC
jgi:hypothetical protein